MQIIGYLLAFIVAVGVIVTVHEFGHYWAARKLGVKVLRFSVGFGKPLLKRVSSTDKIEYVLASIPLGGYVKMLDEREGEVPRDIVHQAFNRQPVWKRFVIVSAGPAFNFVFAVLAYWMAFMVGVEGIKPTVGEVLHGSIARKAEIKSGDTFIYVEDVAVQTWQQTLIQLLDKALESGSAKVILRSKDLSQRVVALDLSDTNHLLSEGELLEKIGITPWRYRLEPVFGEINSGVAKIAGIRAGDRVISVDGKEVNSWADLVTYVRAHAGVSIDMLIRRNSENMNFVLVPERVNENGEAVGRIGAYPFVDQALLDQQRVIVRYNLFDAVVKGMVETWEHSILTLKILWRLVKGEASLKNISGPITIAEYAGGAAAIGFSAFVSALALISIAIGILNLLPIPVLDGGHLLYYLIEIIKGSPVSEQFEVVGQRVGIVLLIGLMSLAFYNDIHRLLQ